MDMETRMGAVADVVIMEDTYNGRRVTLPREVFTFEGDTRARVAERALREYVEDNMGAMGEVTRLAALSVNEYAVDGVEMDSRAIMRAHAMHDGEPLPA